MRLCASTEDSTSPTGHEDREVMRGNKSCRKAVRMRKRRGKECTKLRVQRCKTRACFAIDCILEVLRIEVVSYLLRYLIISNYIWLALVRPCIQLLLLEPHHLISRRIYIEKKILVDYFFQNSDVKLFNALIYIRVFLHHIFLHHY